ncbi:MULTISPECIES: YhdP family protein [Niastella]|uniref:AsmA-like C-terminal domain-containing protein n=1 Tax=Niastella soli TaxID=2821487 RepID=A0ABS3YSY6_9BACT|nr:AsmA-like C-terminal region-containing protein [Niastella soli]MBO9201021.1 hypothetical protein [Niastella soli]
MLTSNLASLKTQLKYLFRILKIFLAVVLTLVVAVVIYVSVNKKKIIRQVTSDISNQLNGHVEIGNIELSFIRNFPHVSLLLHDVSITDTLFNTHRHTFFKGSKVFVSIDVLKLIDNKPPIKGIVLQTGELYLYTDSTGYTNTYLFHLKKDTASGNKQSEAKIELKNVLLRNVRFIVDNRSKGKLHDLVIDQLKVKIDNQENRLLFFTKAEILVKSLAFNKLRGSFVKDKVFRGHFNMAYQKASNRLSFDSINIQLSGQPFNCSGQLEFAGAQPQFWLRLHARRISYDFIRSALPQKTANSLSVVDINTPLSVSANITGPLKGGNPKVAITWLAQDISLQTLFLDFEHASFSGFFSNEVEPGLPRKDPNSVIEIKGFTAQWHGLPVQSEKITILNLSKPLLTYDLTSDFSLTRLNELMGSKTLYLSQGDAHVQLNYAGPLAKNDSTNAFLNGTVSFKDASIEYLPRNVEMNKVTGKLTFKRSDVFIENLHCNVLNNDITMNGQAKDLLTLINTQPDKAIINWNIYMPVMDLGSFLYLFKAKGSESRRSDKKSVLQTMADKMDDFIENGKLHVKLNADKLIYKDFEGRRAVADITLLNDRYLINNVSMDHSGGHIAFTGTLLNKQDFHQANLKINMGNVNVSKVFADFDNFGQNGLTAQSLEGKLTADIEASMNIANDGHVIPATVVSRVDFSLKDGALNNYEPLKKLQRFIFKKRDFDNIRFAELKNRLEISNREVRINRMEIQSSVMSIFIEGIYDQKGTTDLSIQVPLSNLKKRDDDYNPENIGVNKKAGKSIFIRGKPGPDGNIKFNLDLFRSYEKDKKAALSKENEPPYF